MGEETKEMPKLLKDLNLFKDLESSIVKVEEVVLREDIGVTEKSEILASENFLSKEEIDAFLRYYKIFEALGDIVTNALITEAFGAIKE